MIYIPLMRRHLPRPLLVINKMSDIKITISEQLQQLQLFMHRTSFHGFRGRGRGHNLHRGQGRLLAMLKIKPEISQKELSYLLDMSKQSLAELLTKLEKNAYVTREPSEDDRRVLMVKLTEEGEKAAGMIEKNISDTSQILDCLNDEELQNFNIYLSRIIKRYEEQFPNEDFEERRKMMRKLMAEHPYGHRRHKNHGDCENTDF